MRPFTLSNILKVRDTVSSIFYNSAYCDKSSSMYFCSVHNVYQYYSFYQYVLYTNSLINQRHGRVRVEYAHVMFIVREPATYISQITDCYNKNASKGMFLPLSMNTPRAARRAPPPSVLV